MSRQASVRATLAAMLAALGIGLTAALAGCGEDGAAAQAAAGDQTRIAVARQIVARHARPARIGLMGDGAFHPLPAHVAQIYEGWRRIAMLSWSADGRRLAYTGPAAVRRRPRLEPSDVWLLERGAARRLTATGDAGAPALSLDGSTIAFARGRPGGRAIWLMRADGDGQRRLALAPGRRASDIPGSWSPDGTWLAFTRHLPSRIAPGAHVIRTSWVYLASADGRQVRRLARGWAPSWSPDGRRIAFISDRDSTREDCYGDYCRTTGDIYAVDVDGANLRRLTRSVANEDNPAWSPGGRRLAFQRGVPVGNAEAFSVWIMNGDGTCPRAIARDPSKRTWYMSPAWRPAGGGERPLAC